MITKAAPSDLSVTFRGDNGFDVERLRLWVGGRSSWGLSKLGLDLGVFGN